MHALDGQTQIVWEGDNLSRNHIHYVRVNHDFGDLTQFSQRNPGTDGPARNLSDTILNYRGNETELARRPAILEIIKRIEKLAKRDICNLTEVEISSYMPADALAIFQSDINNEYIARAIEFHGVTRISFIADFAMEHNRRPSDEEIKFAVGPSPIEIINDLFSEFEFHLQLPLYRKNQQYYVQFIDQHTKQTLSFGQLSTGEKIIVNVVLWSSSQSLGHHTKLFVLDEIDAHLHPAITKILMRALKEHVVERCNIQVIMSTHSPTTIAYADEDSIFHISRDRSIQPASKDVLIRELTDNFIAITNNEIPLLLDIGHVDSTKIALFVEGPADFKIIKHAAAALGWQHDGIVFIPAFGHPTIKNILTHADELLRPYGAKGYIGLIDYDNAFISFRNSAPEHRMSELKSLSSERQQIWNKGNDTFLMTLPRPTFRSNLASPNAEVCKLEIEHMFRDNVLVKFSEPKLVYGNETYPSIHKKQKMEFADHVRTLAPDEFSEFSNLFDSIDKVAGLVA